MVETTKNFLQKTLALLLQRQTNILSAAFVIMGTIIFSQLLGLVRQRMLAAIFGASDTLGVYLTATKFPDLLFQLIIAGALSSAFIPVFSDYLVKGKEKEANKLASTLLLLGCIVFFFLACVLFIFAPFFVQVFNVGSQYAPADMSLMVNLTRIMLVSQIFFIFGTFFSALLQSHNHFFIPGLAAALYNLGIIIGIVIFSSTFGIYAPVYGGILGALLFILFQIPMLRKVKFSFIFSLDIYTEGVKEVIRLMLPRTLSLLVFQLGTIATVSLISFLSNPGRNYVIFDYAQTLAFAPVGLFGQAIAQAALPILSRERERLPEFKATFLTSFTQMLYLVLPVSVLLLVLRIPVVRLIFGAGQFDWAATVLTGKTLAFFSLSIFAQALTYLVIRGFYALHNTMIPLLVGACTTLFMVIFGAVAVLKFEFGVEGIAASYSIASIANLIILLFFLGKKVGGFDKSQMLIPIFKIFAATACTGIALYVPIKLLDQLVFDTTRTVNLLLLTGISSIIGLNLYLFLTWLFNVKEAAMFILLFKRIGNWREILKNSDEVIDHTRLNP